MSIWTTHHLSEVKSSGLMHLLAEVDARINLRGESSELKHIVTHTSLHIALVDMEQRSANSGTQAAALKDHPVKQGNPQDEKT
eukprot:3492453-Amphidinium_carterae.1